MADRSRVEKKTVFPTGPELKNARASNEIVFMAKWLGSEYGNMFFENIS